MAVDLRIKRRVSGATGAPATLKTGELAWNMVAGDGFLYGGFGDNGSGVATSIKVLGRDDFWRNIPSDGADGNILFRTATGVQWGAAPEGTVYTASDDGIFLNGNIFTLDYTEIATGLGLSTYATDAELAAGLAGKSDTGHTHDAADVVSGVFDIARIPVLPSSVQIVSSGGIANLTAPQQAEIGDGSIVTTTDGRRWVYTGSGSKTAEASYVELADVTPEWSVIANKPAFHAVATSGAYADLTGAPVLATVATSGSYNDLTNKPTLGTIASQNADNVNITGGTISGVSFDGGTF